MGVVLRSLFVELGEASESSKTQCCPIRLKTGVQIVGGVLAILSGVILVLFFAKLDEVIAWKYKLLFDNEISRGTLTAMAGLIVLAIMVNILVILGASGGRWRRALLLPWLLLYGAGIVACLASHLYFTRWKHESLLFKPLLEGGESDWNDLSRPRFHLPHLVVPGLVGGRSGDRASKNSPRWKQRSDLPKTVD